VHDPKEAGDENAEVILNSIVADETTNSVLRISPIVGRGELDPKIVVIPKEDLWKVKYLDEQVLGGTQGGRTYDIDDIARLIVEDNLTGTVQLDEGGIGISSVDNLSQEWEEAVKDNKIVAFFRLELDRVKAKGNFNEEELEGAMNRILEVLKKAGKSKLLSISDMKELGLKCKNALIRPSLRRLYYDGKIENMKVKLVNYWKLKLQNPDRCKVLPANDSGNFDAGA